MFAEMADPATAHPETRTDAARAVARLKEMSSDLRGCAVYDAEGEVLAASGEREPWQEPGRAFFAAADAAGEEPAIHVHVATEDGEVFGVRHQGLGMVAVAERFTLASLMIFDMRAVLRELGKGPK